MSGVWPCQVQTQNGHPQCLRTRVLSFHSTLTPSANFHFVFKNLNSYGVRILDELQSPKFWTLSTCTDPAADTSRQKCPSEIRICVGLSDLKAHLCSPHEKGCSLCRFTSRSQCQTRKMKAELQMGRSRFRELKTFQSANAGPQNLFTMQIQKYVSELRDASVYCITTATRGTHRVNKTTNQYFFTLGAPDPFQSRRPSRVRAEPTGARFFFCFCQPEMVDITFRPARLYCYERAHPFYDIICNNLVYLDAYLRGKHFRWQKCPRVKSGASTSLDLSAQDGHRIRRTANKTESSISV